MEQKTLEDSVREKAEHDKAFENWLHEPTVVMTTSLIPAGDRQDTLKLLLRSAFDAGAKSGSGQTAGTFLRAMLEGMAQNKPEQSR